jgi:hypothetical protein
LTQARDTIGFLLHRANSAPAGIRVIDDKPSTGDDEMTKTARFLPGEITIYTDAPREYDGPTTEEISEIDGIDSAGKVWRRVCLPAKDLVAQEIAYRVVCAAAMPERDFLIAMRQGFVHAPAKPARKRPSADPRVGGRIPRAPVTTPRWSATFVPSISPEARGKLMDKLRAIKPARTPAPLKLTPYEDRGARALAAIPEEHEGNRRVRITYLSMGGEYLTTDTEPMPSAEAKRMCDALRTPTLYKVTATVVPVDADHADHDDVVHAGCSRFVVFPSQVTNLALVLDDGRDLVREAA